MTSGLSWLAAILHFACPVENSGDDEPVVGDDDVGIKRPAHALWTTASTTATIDDARSRLARHLQN